jgi:predicted nuclease of predicted toxin-antitoxin system
VRILLNRNLSPKLVRRLADIIPGLETVYDHDLSEHPTHRFSNGRGMDFVRLVERAGPPPKVIRIERCDFPSKVIEQVLRREALWIHDFLKSDRAVLLLKL